jgi:hypothetical protein
MRSGKSEKRHMMQNDYKKIQAKYSDYVYAFLVLIKFFAGKMKEMRALISVHART